MIVYRLVLLCILWIIALSSAFAQNTGGQTDMPSSDTSTPVIEVRIYKIKPGMREKFIDFFETRAVPALEDAGMTVMGQFVSLEDEETVVWLRAFPSEAVREKMTDDFYSGSTWQNELREEALSMVVDYSNVHVVKPTKRSKIR